MSASVSVIVPACNVGRYVDQALQSVVDQTFEDWEMVVVDDGSTDDTAERCRAWVARDPRIRLMTQARSGGPSIPRNVAIAHSGGEFVALLDPDDYWFPDKLRRQVEAMRSRPDLVLLFDDSLQVDADGASMGSYFEMLRFRERSAEHFDEPTPGLFVARPSFLFFSSCVFTGMQPSGVMLRRSALAGLDPVFAPDLPNAMDIDCWWRVMPRGRTAFTPEALHAYRQHAGGISKNISVATPYRVRAHVRNYQRIRHLLPPEWDARYRRRIAEHHFHVGWQARQMGDTAAARAAYRESLRWQASLKTGVAMLKACVPVTWTASSRHA